MAVIEILEEEGDLGVGVGGVRIISERCLTNQTKEKMRLLFPFILISTSLNKTIWKTHSMRFGRSGTFLVTLFSQVGLYLRF